MSKQHDILISQASKVLEKNWEGSFTIPRAKLYPFQWNWDSGFVSLGWAHLDVQRAMTELDSLFSGQWANGMLPHIIFHSENENTYFPNHDFWKAEVNSGAPVSPKTSGISQPPVHGFILERIFIQHEGNSEVRRFVERLLEKVVKTHEWWYRYRDPKNEGLVSILHPWESGRDNSPLWDDALNEIQILPGSLPPYQRRDTDHADASQRPTADHYDKYVYLLELGKKFRYEESGIYEESPFIIQDTLINAVLIKSNESLIRIGNLIGKDMGQIEELNQVAKVRFNQKLWNEELKCYCCFDLKNDRQIMNREIGSCVSLYAGIPDQPQANLLLSQLVNMQKRGFVLVPSFDIDHFLFDSKRYWRGPVWPQMNWLIYQGLKRYGFNGTADVVRKDLVQLVSIFGFYEYFEANKSQHKNLESGYGGSDFSWTASTILDFIYAP